MTFTDKEIDEMEQKQNEARFKQEVKAFFIALRIILYGIIVYLVIFIIQLLIKGFSFGFT